MTTIQQAVEVRVPVHAAYEQLSQFENYPQFMSGVREVRRLSDQQTHWVMELDGEQREFDARITERRPDERVAWEATDGPALSEAITLRSLSSDRTQVIAELQADVRGLLPSDAHAQESLSRRLKADLDSFKSYCERGGSAQTRQAATGVAAVPDAAAMSRDADTSRDAGIPGDMSQGAGVVGGGGARLPMSSHSRSAVRRGSQGGGGRA